MHVLIVAPRYTFRKGDYYEFPLGLGYICAVLKKDGHTVNVLNLNQFENDNVVSVLKHHLSLYKPGVVLTGGLTAFYHLILEIIDTVKKHDLPMKTVVGGGIVSSEFELMANMLKPDFLVDGEGERTILELVKSIELNIDPATVGGIGYFRNNVFYRTPAREVMTAKEMDELPMPDFDAFGLDEYFSRQTPASEYYLHLYDEPRVLPIITSRSCPLKCTFCFHPLGNKYRMRDLDKISAEIAEMKRRYKLNTLLVLDELMVGSKRHLFQFCDMIKQHNLKWICQLWPNLIDEETIQALSDSGCYYISFGLESASDTILKSMAKTGCTVADMERGLALTRSYKIGIQGNFIFGDKEETVETAMETLNWWHNHKKYQINMSPIIPYPGSPDFRIAVEKGIIKDKEDYIKNGCPPINMSKMSDDEYELLNKEVALQGNDKNNRIFAELLSIEYTHCHSTKAARMFTLSVRCPHCHQVSTYKNFHQVYLNYFKLACRACAQRFDLSPSIFPNNLNFSKNAKSEFEPPEKLWLTPCMPEPFFENMMKLLEISWEQLPIEGFLERDSSKIGGFYFDKYPVLERSKVAELLKNKGGHILILASNHAGAIYDELKTLYGISEQQIIMLDPRVVQDKNEYAVQSEKNMAAQRNDVSWFYQARC